jgi:hypothetical protein
MRPRVAFHLIVWLRTMDKILVIYDLASLRSWRRQLLSITGVRYLPDFQFAELSYEQNSKASALARGYQKACGCRSGGVVMSATAVALLIWHVASGGHSFDSALAYLPSLAGIVLASGLLGKLLELLWARCRLLRLTRNLRVMVGQNSPAGQPVVGG